MNKKSSRITVTITMAGIIKKTGQARAEILGQTFSEYITELIRADNKQIIDAYIKEQLKQPEQMQTKQAEQMKKQQLTFDAYIKADAPKTTPKAKSVISHMTSDTYTPPEVAELLGVSPRHIQKMLKQGKIQGHQDNKNKWHISREEFTRLQAERSLTHGKD